LAVNNRKDEEPFQIKYAVKFGGGDGAVTFVGHQPGADEAESRNSGSSSSGSGSAAADHLEPPSTPPADSALYRYLVANKSYDLDQQRKQRQAAVRLVSHVCPPFLFHACRVSCGVCGECGWLVLMVNDSQACKEVIEKNYNGQVNCEVLHLLGSCQMGVQTADSDVDALCVGPDTMSCSRVRPT
jgi:hypothetical protein